jgi:hypothetical protein
MNWTDIEAKWAAMTRRVQSDQLQDDGDVVIDGAPERPPLLQDDAAKLRESARLDRPAT